MGTYLRWLIPLLLVFSSTRAQTIDDRFRDFIQNFLLESYGIKKPDLVKKFYQQTNYQVQWLKEEKINEVILLVDKLMQAPAYGLNMDDYITPPLKAYFLQRIPLTSAKDSFVTEILFTEAILHFMQHLATGNKPVTLSYNGLAYKPDCKNVVEILAKALAQHSLHSLVNEMEPGEPEYKAVKNLLNLYQNIILQPGFTDVVVKTSSVLYTNQALLHRLYQLGILADTLHLSEEQTRVKLKAAQRLFSLFDDGLLKPATVAALNVPLSFRINELRNTLNTIRWLSCLHTNFQLVVVNIPSATLLFYESGKIILESKIIVGKKTTPTPTLSSTITELVLYPYWNVPYKIATQELLPRIKRSRSYLAENNYQVLDSRGKLVDPASVNWGALSRTYFPYAIRQSTGCDNSLGILKLNFYNPFSVYLHDTPYKILFRSNRRYFSHGCMRVEKALDLARYLLKENRHVIDTLEDKGCLNNQQPTLVPLQQSVPVLVLYHTAWIDSMGNVFFIEDVYKKNQQN
jgi:murein L,D-transpeptidase YcbB/YkuD